MYTVGRENQTCKCLFVHFLSSLLYIIPNNCSTTGHLPFLVWGGIRVTTGELRPRNGPPVSKTLIFVDFCGFCLCIPGVARTYSQATPGQLNVCIACTVCDEFTSRQLSASRCWTIVFSIYLMSKTVLVPWETPLCIYIPLDLCSAIAPVFAGE